MNSPLTAVQLTYKHWYNSEMGEAISALVLSLPLIWLAKRIISIYVTLRVLRTRTSWALIPSEEFDVTLRTIESIAEQLGGAHSWWAYWAYRRAAAVRVKLIGVRGRLLYVWELPSSMEGVLRSIAGMYQVEVVPLDQALERLRDTTTT